jgi:hypothetical protein
VHVDCSLLFSIWRNRLEKWSENSVIATLRESADWACAVSGWNFRATFAVREEADSEAGVVEQTNVGKCRARQATGAAGAICEGCQNHKRGYDN